MHHRAGERAVGAGAQRQVHVGLLRGAGAIGVDHHELGAARLARPGDVGHHVDLGAHRVGAPDHDQVRVRHLLADHAPALAVARAPAGVGQRHADRGVPARIAHRVAQAVDAVALHEAHGAGVEVGPDRLAAVALRRARRTPRRPRRAPRPSRSARSCPSPWARPGAAAAPAGRDDGSARRSARPWRRSRRRCRGCARSRAPCRGGRDRRMVDDALDLERADAGAVVRADGDMRVAGHLAPFFRAPGRAGRDPAVCPQSRPIARRESPRRHARPCTLARLGDGGNGPGHSRLLAA